MEYILTTFSIPNFCQILPLLPYWTSFLSFFPLKKKIKLKQINKQHNHNKNNTETKIK